jgi:beta-glucanase (GH16 family)
VTGGATWKSIWSDEFSGTTVDETKWNVANHANYGSANREDQCYQRGNTTVADGTLQFTARRQTVTGCGRNPHGGASYYFTSGMVTTRAQHGALKMKFRRGYAEIQTRRHHWSAFWLVKRRRRIIPELAACRDRRGRDLRLPPDTIELNPDGRDR